MSAPARFPDWRKRLTLYLSGVGRIAFKDGVHDCALFLAGGVTAMTGQDYAAPYRNRYTTLRGGLRILRKQGFDDHVALAKSHLREKPIAFGCEGDGAVVATPLGDALGIVQGAAIYVLLPTGLALVPLTDASCALEV